VVVAPKTPMVLLVPKTGTGRDTHVVGAAVVMAAVVMAAVVDPDATGTVASPGPQSDP